MAIMDTDTPDLGSYSDPMAPYLSRPALSTELSRLPNNKHFFPPTVTKDTTHNSQFPHPIVSPADTSTARESGFDAHIYYEPSDPVSLAYAQRLHGAIRYAFPHLRVYDMLDGPAGPHPTATFEVAIFSPAEFGEFVPWLTLWHGPLSVLIHTNTEVEGVDSEGLSRAVKDHTDRALWLGEKYPLRTERLGAGPPGPRKAVGQS